MSSRPARNGRPQTTNSTRSASVGRERPVLSGRPSEHDAPASEASVLGARRASEEGRQEPKGANEREPTQLKGRADASDAEHVGVAGDAGWRAGHDHRKLSFGYPTGVDQRLVDLADHVVGVTDHGDEKGLDPPGKGQR